MFLVNVTFEPKCRNNWHIHHATNAGWLGRTFQEIKNLCPNSKVENGMNIVFTEDYTENQLVTSPDEIDNWINNL